MTTELKDVLSATVTKLQRDLMEKMGPLYHSPHITIDLTTQQNAAGGYVVTAKPRLKKYPDEYIVGCTDKSCCG